MVEPALVYLLAASHSGSTLTAMLLNAHPRICTVGELKATNFGAAEAYRCSCHEPIQSCEFWQKVAQEMAAAGLDYNIANAGTSLFDIDNTWVRRLLRPLHRGRGMEFVRDGLLNLSRDWRTGRSRWASRNLALIRSIARVSSSPMIVDSSKIGIRLKYLKEIKGLRLKVVRLVRDGRGVALTYMRPGDFADAKDPSLRGGGSGKTVHDHLSMTDAATQWRRSNEEAANVLASVPNADQIQIRYEDLCRGPQATLHSIHRFLGLEPDDTYQEFRSVEHHVVGNGMRLDSSSEIQLDERWRDALSAADLRQFERVAGDLNRKLGYGG